MQRYIIVDKYRDGEISWEMKPHDHGDIAFYAEALADIEAAVHEWQDIAGQWEDKCQKLTEQIAALETAVKEKDKVIEAFEAMKEGVTERISDLEAAVKEKETTIQESCQIIAEGIKVVENLEEQIAVLTAENKRQAEALRKINRGVWNYPGELRTYSYSCSDMQKIAQDALKGKDATNG